MVDPTRGPRPVWRLRLRLVVLAVLIVALTWWVVVHELKWAR